jgi:hypothetical protein
MSKNRESHKQALRQLLDRSIGSASSAAFKEKLIEEILRIGDRFDYNPGLAEALNSGDGSYKP